MKKVSVLCIVLALILSLGSFAVYGDTATIDRTEIDKKVNAQISDLEKYLNDEASASNINQVIKQYFKQKKDAAQILSKEEAKLLATSERNLVKKIDLGENTFVKFYDDSTIQVLKLTSDLPTNKEKKDMKSAVSYVVPYEQQSGSAEGNFYYNGTWVCDQVVSMRCEYNGYDVRYYSNYYANDVYARYGINRSNGHFKDSSNIIYIGRIQGDYSYNTIYQPYTKYKTMVGIDQYGQIVDPADYGW